MIRLFATPTAGDTPGRMRHRGLIFILAAGLLARLAFAALVPDPVAWPDAREYDTLARNFIAGKGFVIEDGRAAIRTPGYPALVAAVYAVTGNSPRAVAILQAILDVLTAWLLWCLARKILNERAAVLAAGFYAAYPYAIYFTGHLLSETLFTFLLVSGMLILAETERTRGFLAAGLVLGAGALVRPAFLFSPPLAAATTWLAVTDRRAGCRRAGIVLAGAVIAILPWAARNAICLGHFIPGSTKGGWDLYEANNPEATGGVAALDIHYPKEIRGMGECESDTFLRRRAFVWMRENPGRAAGLALVKLRRFWNPAPNDPGHRAGAAFWGSLAIHVPVFLLAFAGGFALWKKPGFAFAAFPILYFSLLHMVFLGSVRYREPVMPFVMLVAAAGAASLGKRLERRNTVDLTPAPPQNQTP
ncbi:MAG: glycosyltransferase family 39 protein [Planctomycetota bacterium]